MASSRFGDSLRVDGWLWSVVDRKLKGDDGGAEGGQLRKCHGRKLTPRTVETSSAQTAVGLSTQRSVTATRETSGCRERRGEKTGMGNMDQDVG